MALVDERDLLIRAQRGDSQAFGELVRLWQTAVYNVAYRLLGRRRDAEDAAQEAFIRAYNALDRFDLQRPFAPWVKRICVNVCLNVLQAQRIRPQVLATDLVGSDGGTPETDMWAVTRVTPEQVIMEAEQARILRQAILDLPPHYRVVIELRYFQDLSYLEMVDVLQRPLSSIKSDLFRARKQLAKLLRLETALAERS